MANIAITTYCNLHCPYCFANEMIETEQKNNIEISRFKEIVNWLTNNPTPIGRIGIIGGEPTLHPKFNEILEYLEKISLEKNIPSILFTNGIYLNKYINDIPNSMKILLNYNIKTAMSEEQYNSLSKNIDILYKKGWLDTTPGRDSKVTIGCNLCREIDDYSWFFDLVKKYKLLAVRISVTAPTSAENLKDKYNYYTSMKEKFLSFVDFAIENQIILNKDCNQIPLCYFDADELKKITAVCIPKEDHLCEPVVDITPDFMASSCFGAYELVNCLDFNNYNEVAQYLLYKKMVPNILNNNDYPCNNCKKHELLQCQGGCLAFSKHRCR